MAVIAGNWKMHMGAARTRSFFAELRLDEGAAKNELLLFPPTVSLQLASECADRDPRIQLGVQNIHWEDEGAFTGETSALMAKEAGASHVLIGHSERRHVFGETNDEVALKIQAGCRHGLTPVVCVGETLGERRDGRVAEVILKQLDAALGAMEGAGEQNGRLLIAYEPVWAIGTGETATPDDAARAHRTLRTRLESVLGLAAAVRTPILYGGSVKPQNAADLLAATDVDGVLVGGASLDPASFAQIASAGGG
ncbi:MAG TPA: triose-phosphate isomerase [Gemmatimonadetes bacterium]|nr:triose-phosphate isomerase [Gemmatimonadota bacterium]